MNKLYKFIICFTVFSFVSSTNLQAGPVIDGKYDPGEGYSFQSDIQLKDKHGNLVTPETGKLYYHTDNSFLYGFFSLPKSYVDNSYGVDGNDNSVDWGSKTHRFKDLLRSDAAQFDLMDGQGDSVMTIGIDYLKQNGGTNIPALEFFAEGEVLSGQDAWLLDVATSLEYNSIRFNEFLDGNGVDPIGEDMASPKTLNNLSYEVEDAFYEDWIFEVNYEFQVDLLAFGGDGFGSFDIDRLHASPSKVDVDKYMLTPPVPVTPPVTVPEPSTYALLGSFLLFSSALRRRRQAMATVEH